MAAVVNVTLDQLAAQLGADAARARNFLGSPAGDRTRKKIGLLGVAGVKEGFDRGVSPEGVAWLPPLIRPGKPLLDQGLLRAATTAVVTAQGVELHNNRVQAGLMQRGGTIRARKQFLAIPITPEARRAGSPRSMSGLHFQQKKGSRSAVLADEKGNVQFILKPSVTIRARPFLGWSTKTLDRVEIVLRNDFTAYLLGGQPSGR